MLKNESVSALKKEKFSKIYSDGDKISLFEFNKQEDVDEWVISSDKDWDEGFSKAEFNLSGDEHAVFSGHIDSSTLPLDGTTGWRNIERRSGHKSFYRFVEF